MADASNACESFLHERTSSRLERNQNSELLRLAEGEFDLFITSDQNIRYQQNLAGQQIAILELSTNDLHRIQAASALVKEAVDKISESAFEHLDIP